MVNLNTKAKKVLVTGGTGFIGSHLVEKLCNAGFDILVIDKFCHKQSYFIHQNLYNKVAFKQVDICRRLQVENLINSYKPDYIFHLAAEAIVGDSYSNPYKTFQTNIMGTINILESARKSKNIKGILVTSSDKAYGKTK